MFGRKPRKVGFGIERAPNVSRNRAWGKSPRRVGGAFTKPGTSPRENAVETTPKKPDPTPTDGKSGLPPEALEQINALKKRSPWLGNIAHKLATAQARGGMGDKKFNIPGPKKRSPKLALIIIVIAIFFFLGPILSSLAFMFG